jgi:hypothetical protein
VLLVGFNHDKWTNKKSKTTMDAIKKCKLLLRRLANYGTSIFCIYFKPPKWENQIQENGPSKCGNIKLG